MLSNCGTRPACLAAGCGCWRLSNGGIAPQTKKKEKDCRKDPVRNYKGQKGPRNALRSVTKAWWVLLAEIGWLSSAFEYSSRTAVVHSGCTQNASKLYIPAPRCTLGIPTRLVFFCLADCSRASGQNEHTDRSAEEVADSKSSSHAEGP